MPAIFSPNKPNLGTLQMPRRYRRKVYLLKKSKHGLYVGVKSLAVVLKHNSAYHLTLDIARKRGLRGRLHLM
jgi:hypothetical protein